MIKACEVCGDAFEAVKYHARYCSKRCTMRAYRAGRPLKDIALSERECERCGIRFRPPNRKQRFCSRSCAGEARRRLGPKPTAVRQRYPCIEDCGALVWHPRDRCRPCYYLAHKAKPKIRICPGCGQEFEAKRCAKAKGDGSGWTVTCSKSCVMKIRPRVTPYYDTEKGRTKALAQARRRRMLLKAAGWDGVTDEEILERDGWVCQICLGPIDQALRYPAPLSRSVDHVIPLVRGGDDTAANKQAAHLACNREKGAA